MILRDAKDAGVAQATLYTAKTILRVRSEKIGVEGWQWSLPTKEEDCVPKDHDNHNLRNVHNLRGGYAQDSTYVWEDYKGTEGYDDAEPEGPRHHLRRHDSGPTPRVDTADPVQALLADPPEWLANQLAKYHEDPARFKKPTCAAIAAEVFDAAERWREVVPLIEARCFTAQYTPERG